MEDNEIIELYFNRDEAALSETDKKYRSYLTRIAENVLHNPQDGQEAVNDTYLKAWNAMPPHKPNLLSAFLGKITRSLAIDKLRTYTREKRGGSSYQLSLDELCDIVSGSDPTEELDVKQLAAAISEYLRSVDKEKRAAFVWRYYYCDSIGEICSRLDCGESRVKSLLHRTRQGLKQKLESEGFDI